MRPPGGPVGFRRERSAGTGPGATTNLPPVPPALVATSLATGGTGGRNEGRGFRSRARAGPSLRPKRSSAAACPLLPAPPLYM